MKLVCFSVKNFRSIKSASGIHLDDISILVGKNNEGKSNLLNALNIAMNALKKYGGSKSNIPRRISYSRLRSRRLSSDIYRWDYERDFPILLQNKNSKLKTSFVLEFRLSDEEIKELKKEIGITLKSPIEIVIVFNATGSFDVTIKNVKCEDANINGQIAGYISKKINFVYIPAVRTEEEAKAVVYDLASIELKKIEDDSKYINALNKIRDLQQPIIKDLEKRIKTSLLEMLPSIKDVSIETTEHMSRMSLRPTLEIQVDDGNMTNLENKGDGIKSLAAMALLKDMSYKDGTMSLVAIEEPESHLHPEAINILRETIYSLTKNNQVIVSTHNPLFVDRINIKSNIIVEKGKAKPAKKIEEIRSVLGVHVSDNLFNSRCVLLVEGQTDELILTALLSLLSIKLKKALNSKFLAIMTLHGTGYLNSHLNMLQNSLCIYHVFLDNDSAGKGAFEKAKNYELLTEKDITFINAEGLKESEIEDCIDSAIYKDAIKEKYGVNLDVSDFTKSKDKWSDRMKKVFEGQGKLWNDGVEKELKVCVSNCVKDNPKKALRPYRTAPINKLVEELEAKIVSCK